MNKIAIISKCIALLPLILLIGCESVPEETETPTATKYPFIQMAPSGPPEAPLEYKLSPSDPMREIWRQGYWKFDGISYEWVPGELILRPSPASVWAPDRWEFRTYGWVFIPGYWQ